MGRMGRKKMSVYAKQWLEEIITSEPKTVNTILDDIYIFLDKREHRNVFKRIPTRGELISFLDANYSKVRLSNFTGKPVKGYGNSKVYFFKEEK
tara:strand:+ start:370 stop:651 length:282 start_codon:yes stop_codon:yes gene_type:complete